MWYKDGKVFGSVTAIRNDNKNMSLPMVVNDELISELGYQPIVVLDTPEYDVVTQYIVELPVDMVNGVPTIGYAVENKSQEQITAESAVSIPTSVTPRQARLALLDYGLLDEVEAMAAGDREFHIWFEYSLTIERYHPKVESIGASFGLTSDQIDQLFIAASAKGDL